MPAPKFTLPVTGTAPKVTTREGLEVGIDAVSQALFDQIGAIATGLQPAGNWDASAGTFPSGAALGTYYVVNVAGTVSGQAFAIGDWLIPLRSSPSTTVYAFNWFRADYSKIVPAGLPRKSYTTVAGMTADGTVGYSGTALVVSAGDILEAQGFRYEVAASGATDHHLTTAGGVKLYVLPGAVTAIEAYGAVAGADCTTAIDAALSAQSAGGFALSTLTAGEYIYTGIPAAKVDYVGEGRIVRAAGKPEWWAFERKRANKLHSSLTPVRKFRSMLQASLEGVQDDLTYICVGDSTRAGNNQEIYKHVRDVLMPFNVECVISAASGRTADGWGNATGAGPKWDDLLGANPFTFDAIPGTGSTTLLDICLGINDTANTTTDNIDAVVADLKNGIDNLIAARADLLVNLTVPNRLRNQPLKTSKCIQIIKELAEASGWSWFDMVAATLPNDADAVASSDFYADDTHPSEFGQRVMAQTLADHLTGGLRSNLVPNCGPRLTDGKHANAQLVEDAFDWIVAQHSSGWQNITLWRFDADTFYFANPTGSSSISTGFKPLINTEAVLPANNGPHFYEVFDVGAPAGGGTWARTRKFAFKIRDLSALSSIPVGAKIPLSPGIVGAYPANTFVPDRKRKRPRLILSAYNPGVATDGEYIARHVCTDPFTFEYSFYGSGADAKVAATGSTAFNIKKNGSNIGTVTFAASGTSGTLATSPFARVSFVEGDVLEVQGPLTADATLADIAITLWAKE